VWVASRRETVAKATRRIAAVLSPGEVAVAGSIMVSKEEVPL